MHQNHDQNKVAAAADVGVRAAAQEKPQLLSLDVLDGHTVRVNIYYGRLDQAVTAAGTGVPGAARAAGRGTARGGGRGAAAGAMGSAALNSPTSSLGADASAAAAAALPDAVQQLPPHLRSLPADSAMLHMALAQSQAQQDSLVAQDNLRMQETQLTMTLQMQMQAHEQMAARVQAQSQQLALARAQAEQAKAHVKATSPAHSPKAAPGFSLPSLGGMPAVGGAAIGLGAPAVAPGTGGTSGFNLPQFGPLFGGGAVAPAPGRPQFGGGPRKAAGTAAPQQAGAPSQDVRSVGARRRLPPSASPLPATLHLSACLLADSLPACL